MSFSADQRKVTAQKNQQLREASYHLVVKIIRWRSGTAVSDSKITSQEWMEYKKHLLSSVEKDETDKLKEINSKLKETQQAITDHGGFALD